jgi:nucleotide-binding universal stress UspA family protein
MKILVPVDGSKSAANAAKYAAKLASALRTKDRVTLVSVHDDHALRHARKFVGKQQVEDYLREVSDADLKAAHAHLNKAGVTHDAIIRQGHVAEEIVRLANSGKFDLVIMGSKGRSQLADLLLGSVVQRVMATAKIPVLVVK